MTPKIEPYLPYSFLQVRPTKHQLEGSPFQDLREKSIIDGKGALVNPPPESQWTYPDLEENGAQRLYQILHHEQVFTLRDGQPVKYTLKQQIDFMIRCGLPIKKIYLQGSSTWWVLGSEGFRNAFSSFFSFPLDEAFNAEKRDELDAKLKKPLSGDIDIRIEFEYPSPSHLSAARSSMIAFIRYITNDPSLPDQEILESAFDKHHKATYERERSSFSIFSLKDSNIDLCFVNTLQRPWGMAYKEMLHISLFPANSAVEGSPQALIDYAFNLWRPVDPSFFQKADFIKVVRHLASGGFMADNTLPFKLATLFTDRISGHEVEIRLAEFLKKSMKKREKLLPAVAFQALLIMGKRFTPQQRDHFLEITQCKSDPDLERLAYVFEHSSFKDPLSTVGRIACVHVDRSHDLFGSFHWPLSENGLSTLWFQRHSTGVMHHTQLAEELYHQLENIPTTKSLLYIYEEAFGNELIQPLYDHLNQTEKLQQYWLLSLALCPDASLRQCAYQIWKRRFSEKQEDKFAKVFARRLELTDPALAKSVLSALWHTYARLGNWCELVHAVSTINPLYALELANAIGNFQGTPIPTVNDFDILSKFIQSLLPAHPSFAFRVWNLGKSINLHRQKDYNALVFPLLEAGLENDLPEIHQLIEFANGFLDYSCWEQPLKQKMRLHLLKARQLQGPLVSLTPLEEKALTPTDKVSLEAGAIRQLLRMGDLLKAVNRFKSLQNSFCPKAFLLAKELTEAVSSSLKTQSDLLIRASATELALIPNFQSIFIERETYAVFALSLFEHHHLSHPTDRARALHLYICASDIQPPLSVDLERRLNETTLRILAETPSKGMEDHVKNRISALTPRLIEALSQSDTPITVHRLVLYLEAHEIALPNDTSSQARMGASFASAFSTTMEPQMLNSSAKAVESLNLSELYPLAAKKFIQEKRFDSAFYYLQKYMRTTGSKADCYYQILEEWLTEARAMRQWKVVSAVLTFGTQSKFVDQETQSYTETLKLTTVMALDDGGEEALSSAMEMAPILLSTLSVDNRPVELYQRLLAPFLAQNNPKFVHTILALADQSGLKDISSWRAIVQLCEASKNQALGVKVWFILSKNCVFWVKDDDQISEVLELWKASLQIGQHLEIGVLLEFLNFWHQTSIGDGQKRAEILTLLYQILYKRLLEIGVGERAIHLATILTTFPPFASSPEYEIQTINEIEIACLNLVRLSQDPSCAILGMQILQNLIQRNYINACQAINYANLKYLNSPLENGLDWLLNCRDTHPTEVKHFLLNIDSAKLTPAMNARLLKFRHHSPEIMPAVYSYFIIRAMLDYPQDFQPLPNELKRECSQAMQELIEDNGFMDNIESLGKCLSAQLAPRVFDQPETLMFSMMRKANELLSTALSAPHYERRSVNVFFTLWFLFVIKGQNNAIRIKYQNVLVDFALALINKNHDLSYLDMENDASLRTKILCSLIYLIDAPNFKDKERLYSAAMTWTLVNVRWPLQGSYNIQSEVSCMPHRFFTSSFPKDFSQKKGTLALIFSLLSDKHLGRRFIITSSNQTNVLKSVFHTISLINDSPTIYGWALSLRLLVDYYPLYGPTNDQIFNFMYLKLIEIVESTANTSETLCLSILCHLIPPKTNDLEYSHNMLMTLQKILSFSRSRKNNRCEQYLFMYYREYLLHYLLAIEANKPSPPTTVQAIKSVISPQIVNGYLRGQNDYFAKGLANHPIGIVYQGLLDH